MCTLLRAEERSRARVSLCIIGINSDTNDRRGGGYIRAKSWCYRWEGHMWSVQWNMEFWHQLSIYLGLKKTIENLDSADQSQDLLDDFQPAVQQFTLYNKLKYFLSLVTFWSCLMVQRLTWEDLHSCLGSVLSPRSACSHLSSLSYLAVKTSELLSSTSITVHCTIFK